MRIVVIGGGSVGLFLAARLQLHGTFVQLITRTAGQASVLREQGLQVHTLAGEVVETPIHALPFQDSLPPADIYLITVKQPDIKRILPSLDRLPRSARVIAFQNGMGHREALEEVLAQHQIFYAVNTEGTRRISTKKVEHTGQGILRIGPWDQLPVDDPIVQSFTELARSCGIPAVLVNATGSYIWRKVLANVCINPLTSLFEVSNGFLLTSPSLLATMRLLFEEAASVAACLGQQMKETDWQDILTICRNTSRNYSSMLQDVWAGKQTEIDAINGYIADKGMELGISTPMNETVRRIVHLKTTMGSVKGGATNGHDR